MNALWQIILQILWRLRPVQALEVNLHDAIQLGFNLFTAEDDLDDLARNKPRRARLAAAFFDAHRKLDLLIYLRACEIMGITTRLGFKPDYSHTHASTDLTALWRSFQRLVAKFDDYERLAQRRAEHIRRHPPALRYGGPLRLDATHRSTSLSLRLVEATHRRLASATSQKWGRWIARACVQDGLARRSAAKAAGGACVFARGPPQLPTSYSQLLPRRLHLRARALMSVASAPASPARRQPSPDRQRPPRPPEPSA